MRVGKPDYSLNTLYKACAQQNKKGQESPPTGMYLSHYYTVFKNFRFSVKNFI